MKDQISEVERNLFNALTWVAQGAELAYKYALDGFTECVDEEERDEWRGMMACYDGMRKSYSRTLKALGFEDLGSCEIRFF